MKIIAKSVEIIAIFGIIIALIAYLAVPTAEGLIMAADIYCFAAAVLVFGIILDRSRGALSFIYALFFMIFFAFPIPFQLSLDQLPWKQVAGQDEMGSGFLVLVGGHLCIETGFHCSQILGRFSRRPARVTLMTGSSPVQILIIVFVITIAAGCAVYLGPANLLASRNSEMKATLVDSGFKNQLSDTFKSVSLVCFLMAAAMAKNCRFRSVPILALLLTTGVVAIVYNNPVGNARFVFLGTCLAVSAVFFSYNSKRVKSIATGAAVLLVLYLPSLKRLSTGSNTTSVDKGWLALDFDPFQWITNGYIFFEKEPLRYGVNFAEVPLFWVPRALWPDKPLDSGSIVATRLGYEYTNVSFPIQAESLISFGVIGLIVISFLIGYALSKVEQRSAQNLADFGAITISGITYAVLAGFLPIILRGALNATAQQYGSAILFIAIFSLLTKKNSRTPRSLFGVKSGLASEHVAQSDQVQATAEGGVRHD